MRLAAQITKGLQNRSGLVEFHHTASVDIGKQPFIGRQPPGHALAETRIAQGKGETRRAHAEPGHPIAAVGGPVDVVGIAGQVLDHQFGLTLLRAVEPPARDAAAPCLRVE